MPALLARHNVPGLAMAVIRQGTLVWSQGFGRRDRERQLPVDGATILEAASMSKPVFAYAVMKLCERGVINLDTPLASYPAPPFIAWADSGAGNPHSLRRGFILPPFASVRVDHSRHSPAGLAIVRAREREPRGGVIRRGRLRALRKATGGSRSG